MNSLSKLEHARGLIEEAGKLVNEALSINKSLANAFGGELSFIASYLHNLSDNTKAIQVTCEMPLTSIIASEGANWHLHNDIEETKTLPVSNNDSYFPDNLRSWITEVLSTDQTSTNSDLVKLFIGAGIDKNIARYIIASEREKCQLKGHVIDFSEFEPVDDRIFTASNMYDFTYSVAQEAMVAGFEGRKYIGNVSVEQYIHHQLDLETGDDSAESWVPKHAWPTEATVAIRLSALKRETVHPKKPPGKRRKM